MKKEIKTIVIFFIISFIYQILFSINTSFLYKHCYIDVNGMNTLSNLVATKASVLPYKDLFTTSGPFIYCLMNIGYSLGKFNGILLLQVMAMTITLYYIWKMSFQCQMKYRFFIELVCIFLYMFTLASGASSVEWALPFVSMIMFYSFYYEEKLITSFIIGLFIGCLFMIHVVYGILGLITIIVFKKKIIILLGIIIPIFIAFIYMIITGTFNSFINMIIEYQYPLFIQYTSITVMIKRLIKCLPLVTFIFPICTYWKNHNKKSIYYILIAMCLLCYFMFGEEIWVKFGILTIYIPVCLIIMLEKYHIKYITPIIISIIVLLVPFKNFIMELKGYYINNLYQEEYQYINDIKGDVDKNQKKIVIIDVSNKYYLMLDMDPQWFYYDKQSVIGSHSEKISQEMYDYLWDGKFKGKLYITSARGGIYENIDQYLCQEINNYSEPIAVYVWQNSKIEHIH